MRNAYNTIVGKSEMKRPFRRPRNTWYRGCLRMVLRRIFGPKRHEVTGGWRKCIMRSFIHSLYPSPNIIRMMKSRRMRWAGHVARM
jgi:hypothetical protein